MHGVAKIAPPRSISQSISPDAPERARRRPSTPPSSTASSASAGEAKRATVSPRLRRQASSNPNEEAGEDGAEVDGGVGEAIAMVEEAAVAGETEPTAGAGEDEVEDEDEGDM